MGVNPKSNPKKNPSSKPKSPTSASSGSKPVRSKRPKVGDSSAGKPRSNSKPKAVSGPVVQKATPARRAALEVISEVRRRDAYAHEVMSAVLAKLALDPREAGFATRLAYGVVATRGTLDAVVSPYLSDPERTQPEVRDALALSAYEMLFEGTEPHVAVSQGVDLVRSVVPRAAGLANAVLRKVGANLAVAGLQTEGSDAAALASRYGHPEWLAALLVERFGGDLAEDIMDANNQPAPLFLAQLPWAEKFKATVSSLKESGAEPEALELAGAIVAHNSSAGVRSMALERGSVVVADGGAQLAVNTIPLVAIAPPASPDSPVSGDRPTILDIGSGRGTKTFLIAAAASRAGADVSVVGVELHPFKVEAAQARALALSAPFVSFVLADATKLADPSMTQIPASVEAVLVDAPCSGLGTLRRHPDRRWRAVPEEIATLAELDLKLLEASASRVAPGGTLIYSTCTITREENEGVVERFLAGVGEGAFEMVPFEPAEFPEIWRHFVTPEGYFQSVPLAGGIDGHFIARMRRIG